MQRSREKKLNHFYSLYKGGIVLDVGLSGRERVPSTNIFLKTFKYPERFYTGLGVQDLSELATQHPNKCFVQYPGGTFPFNDQEFDWVFSNAVIEHVGDKDAQLKFINEMLRVGNNVFFTTPNKYFLFETHTNVLFLHWNDELFYQWCKRFRPLRNRNILYLFSYRRLNTLMQVSNANQYKVYKNRLFGYTMTFTVVSKGHSS